MTTSTRLGFLEDMTIYHAAGQKEQIVAALVAAGSLELDLSQVGEIDTAGLQLLIMAKREAARLGKHLTVVAHSPAVRQTIDFCNLTGFFGDPVIIPAREHA